MRRQASFFGFVVLLLIVALPEPISAQSNPKDGQASGSSSATSKPAPAPGARNVDENFVIGADDILAINVWKEPDISRSLPVRSDGKITLPLIGDVQAGGQTPHQLEKEIASRLQNYISEPEVTVMVQEVRSQKYNILGQIARPGSYPLTGPATVLDAIALAGGFRDFAKKKSIYVLRSNADGTQSRIPFNYSEVIKGKHPEQNIVLKPKDTIVIP